MFWKNNLKTAEFLVEGMMCEHCVKRIQSELKNLKGVKTVKAKLDTKTVTAEYSPEKIQASEIVEALQKMGYKEAKELA